MRKQWRILAALVAVVLLCAACSGTSNAQIDVNKLAASLLDGVTFGETLTRLDTDAVERVYRIDPSLVTAASMYIGSGATVDEVSVFEGVDESAAEQIEATLQQRLATEEEDYADYKPEEVPKLQNATLERSGKYVALCVTTDSDTAKSIIQDTMGR